VVLVPKDGAVLVAVFAGLGLVAGLFEVAPPNSKVPPDVLFKLPPNREVGLVAVVVVASFALFPKLADVKPPSVLAPVVFPNRLLGLLGFVALVVFAAFVLLLFTAFVVIPPRGPAVLVLVVRLLLVVLLDPPKSEIFGLLLLAAVPPILKLVLGAYLLPAPPLNRLPEVLAEFIEAPLFVPNSEEVLGENEAADDVEALPPNKPAAELLFAAGRLLFLFWLNRLVLFEVPALPKILAPGAVLLFIPCLYENYKIQAQHIQVPISNNKIINISLFL
jgi:hypothetical protein